MCAREKNFPFAMKRRNVEWTKKWTWNKIVINLVLISGEGAQRTHYTLLHIPHKICATYVCVVRAAWPCFYAIAMLKWMVECVDLCSCCCGTAYTHTQDAMHGLRCSVSALCFSHFASPPHDKLSLTISLFDFLLFHLRRFANSFNSIQPWNIIVLLFH